MGLNSAIGNTFVLMLIINCFVWILPFKLMVIFEAL